MTRDRSAGTLHSLVGVGSAAEPRVLPAVCLGGSGMYSNNDRYLGVRKQLLHRCWRLEVHQDRPIHGGYTSVKKKKK